MYRLDSDIVLFVHFCLTSKPTIKKKFVRIDCILFRLSSPNIFWKNVQNHSLDIFSTKISMIILYPMIRSKIIVTDAKLYFSGPGCCIYSCENALSLRARLVRCFAKFNEEQALLTVINNHQILWLLIKLDFYIIMKHEK